MKSEKFKVKSSQRLRRAIRPVRILLYFSLFAFNLSLLSVFGQADPLDQAPPPLRTVSKEEKTQLSDLVDVKNHTRLALELMNGRLVQAEHLNSATDFDGMFKELGGFHGLLDNTFERSEERRVGK